MAAIDTETAAIGKARTLHEAEGEQNAAARCGCDQVMTAVDALAQLRKAYDKSGLEVRYLPDCPRQSPLRWQIVGRNNGHIILLAYGSSPGRLLGCLEARVRAQASNGHRV